MKIEISPKKYWINCSYEEDLLYCFQLVIDGKAGWRLPTYDEAFEFDIFPCWFSVDSEGDHLGYSKFWTQPVRDKI